MTSALMSACGCVWRFVKLSGRAARHPGPAARPPADTLIRREQSGRHHMVRLCVRLRSAYRSRFAISDHAEPVSVRDAASGREQAGGPRSLVAESHDQTREGTDVPRRRRYVPGGPEVVGWGSAVPV